MIKTVKDACQTFFQNKKSVMTNCVKQHFQADSIPLPITAQW